MHKLLTFALAIAVCLETTALLANRGHGVLQTSTEDAHLVADGAFRDGLYLGRLDAEDGRPQHPPIARWTDEQDRASFVSGYRHGYNDSLADAASGANRRD